MHDYPNLMTIMRMRGKSRKDCAKAIGCNRTTLYKKLHGQADWCCRSAWRCEPTCAR